jgi:hypothetical protein
VNCERRGSRPSLSAPEFIDALGRLRDDHIVIDLVRLPLGDATG